MRPAFVGAMASRRLGVFPYLPDNLPHSKWRITEIQLSGSFLEMSELQLFASSVNMNTFAVKTASHTPFSHPGNPLTNLFDGSLSTRCNWEATTAETGLSFWVQWDFGAGSPEQGPVLIDGVKQGGFDDSGRTMTNFTLQYFSDTTGSWVSKFSKSGLAYPGNNTLSALYTA